MLKHVLILVGALVLAGCNHDNGGANDGGAGSGGTGGGGGDVDMAMGGDMAETGLPPAPTATHVGATGITSNLVTDGAGHAAYLVGAAPVMSGSFKVGIAGELHVTSADGSDVTVAAKAFQHTYALAPDGSALFYIGFDPTSGPTSGTASLNMLPLKAGAMSKQIVASGMPVTNLQSNPLSAAVYSVNPLTQESFFSPSSKYFLVAIAVAKDSTTPDLHVIDTSSGSDVYQRPNGGFVYSQLVLPDDTMLFQDTAGGTSSTTTPVQTLYWVALPGTTAAATIATHTASFTTTADNKTLVILGTNGNLSTWDLTAKSGAPKVLASSVALFTLGGDATGPIAWVSGDRSVHVAKLDGTKLCDLDATTANADIFGTIRLAPGNGHVYFWQNAEQQNNRGSLYHAAVMSGAMPNKIGGKISIPDLQITDSSIVFLQNVDDVGRFGDAAFAALDGSGVTSLGTKAAVGGLRVANPAAQTWFGLHLNAAVADATNVPIDGSPAITGALAFSSAAGDVKLDAAVHQGAFSLSDSGRAAVFAGGAAWNASASNWVGALLFIATAAPSTVVDGKLAGVSEIGRIAGRKLFVSAPGATPAGIYFVSY